MSHMSVVVVDIDLSRSVEEIINDHVEQLTAHNEETIAKIVMQRRDADINKLLKKTEAEKAKETKTEALQKTFNTLLARSDAGGWATVDELAEWAAPTYGKTSVVLQLRRYVGSTHIDCHLDSRSSHGKKLYRILRSQTAQQPAEQTDLG